jgi:hypothetical protein
MLDEPTISPPPLSLHFKSGHIFSVMILENNFLVSMNYPCPRLPFKMSKVYLIVIFSPLWIARVYRTWASFERMLMMSLFRSTSGKFEKFTFGHLFHFQTCFDMGFVEIHFDPDCDEVCWKRVLSKCTDDLLKWSRIIPKARGWFRWYIKLEFPLWIS